MNTRAFSKTTLEQFNDNVSAIVTQFQESVRSAERARRAVAALQKQMTNMEVNLKKHEKDNVRGGRKNLNKNTFTDFVVTYLSRCHSEKHLDDIVKSAIDCGVVSTNKDGLRSSIQRATYAVASTKGTGVKSLGNGFFVYKG